MIFEIDVIRKICEVENGKRRWRIRSNNETEQILKNKNIVKYIKLYSIIE